jgi:hypothetical protein
MKRALAALVVVGVVASAPTLAAVGGPPSEINGLTVAPEKISKPGARSSRDYLTDIRLYSLRRKKELVGTLQIGRFRDTAPTTHAFRRSIAGQVGTSVVQEHRLAGMPVFVTKGKRLGIAVWFRDTDMFVLSIRDDYGAPKSLIRSALEIEP